ncbi:MAG: leucine-rich repeat domain-containing protein [Candidatus Peribacteria bacterium]|jgi:hypothetical protein|nr:leucine-rich repeat domain-containing protein [Candidatus Peribacteria bacterium]
METENVNERIAYYGKEGLKIKKNVTKTGYYSGIGYHKSSDEFMNIEKVPYHSTPYQYTEEDLLPLQDREREQITKVIIPEKSYCESTILLRNLPNLAKVIFPEDAQEIRGIEIQNCENLKEISLPKEVKLLGGKNQNGKICQYAKHLRKFTLNEGIERIPDHAFEYCTQLEVQIPASVRYIGYGAFSGCANKHLLIPKNVSKIQYSAFQKMPNLQSVTIEGKIEDFSQFEDNAFFGCEQLKKATINGKEIDLEYLAGTSVMSLGPTEVKNGITTGLYQTLNGKTLFIANAKGVSVCTYRYQEEHQKQLVIQAIIQKLIVKYAVEGLIPPIKKIKPEDVFLSGINLSNQELYCIEGAMENPFSCMEKRFYPDVQGFIPKYVCEKCKEKYPKIFADCYSRIGLPIN